MRLLTVNGRVAQDVTPQLSRQGTQFISFSIASTEFNDEKGGDGKPKTQWYRVTAFEPRLVSLSKYLTKGKPIIVTGDYSNRMYQSQKTGMYGIDNDIVATKIYFEIGGERQENAGTTQQSGGVLTDEQLQNQITSAIDEIPQATTSKAKSNVRTTSSSANVADSAIEDDALPF